MKFSYTLRKTINLGESWSFCNLLSFTPSLPSKNMLTDVNICRLRSGGALSVLYWYNWGPRPYNQCFWIDVVKYILTVLSSCYIPVLWSIPSCYLIFFCEYFPALGLFWRILPAEGPQNNSQQAGSLGCCAIIHIALQEVCVSIVIIHSQINKDKGNKQLIVAWIQFPFKSVLTGLPER